MTDNHWLVYKTHIFFVRSLKITVLQTVKHHHELNEFTEKLIVKMNEMRQYFSLEELFLYKNYTFDDNFDIIDIGGHIIIVWSIEVLTKFLKTAFGTQIGERRGTYAIFIIFHEYCHTVYSEISKLLQHLWMEYGTLNVLAQTPCSCVRKSVYKHFAFNRTGTTWGVTRSYDPDEILTNVKLIERPSVNFNGFPLKVSLFWRIPNVLKSQPKFLSDNPIYGDLSHSKGYAGIDAFLLGNLAEHFNFEPIIIQNKEREPFGRVLDNGTITGSLADVVNRKVHYSPNGRFLKNYDTRKIEFTVPYDSDKFCMVVPKSPKIPAWRTLFTCFSCVTWSAIFLVSLLCVVFWFWIGPSRQLSKATWQVYACLVGIPVKIVPTLGQAFFLTACFVFNIIIIGVIDGAFFTEFSTTVFYGDINTLDDLYKSNLPIATNYWYLVGDDESELMTKLKTRVVPTHGRSTYDQVAEGLVATWGRKQDLDRIIRIEYTGKDGVPLLHMVRECHSSFLIVDIVPKGSPFLFAFNSVIMRLFEGGFTSKWYRDVSSSIETEATKGLDRGISFASFTIYDMQAAFRVMVLGHGCSMVVFVLEFVTSYVHT
ncbi:hypothetical protein Zmor_019377 [Zophobas morio]|uniref:Ionotropic receptor n=1 Tax=Zophobas morio TaxID=2755281 RepID=A0AA38HZK8_9CUCU|nr:hypothetical protein Zmor_019377 [Zophobas morio]